MFRYCCARENMDSSKRQFLAQLGVLTAGASLVPLAEAKFPFSPARREGSSASLCHAG
jgi:tetrathionate reductase subunit B